MFKVQIRRALTLVIVAAFLLVPTTVGAQPFAGQLEIGASAHGTLSWFDALWFHVRMHLRVPLKSSTPEGNSNPTPPPLQNGGGFDPWG